MLYVFYIDKYTYTIMDLYLTGAFEYMDVRVGFGNAAKHIYECFSSAGLNPRVKRLNDESSYVADVEICFDQPHKYKFMCPTSYKIGYTPWESTDVPSIWHKPLQNCDEIWTPNQFGYEVFKNLYPDKKIFVYQHGISPKYRPKKRKLSSDRPFTFLFIGEPYARKDGQLVTETFIELFGNNPDYRLIIKGTHQNTIMVQDPRSQVMGSPSFYYKNIDVVTEMLTPRQMTQLYEMSDVFVYPTWGEGWGFNPMQAMAMGIPTISTFIWSDYAQYITLPIDSYHYPSPWPQLHPGYMFKPDQNQFKKAMAYIKPNYNELAAVAFKNSFEIHKNFNWDKVSVSAIERLQNIFSTLELKT